MAILFLRLIPTWNAWWTPFNGFDWVTRYSLPFSNSYAIRCTGPNGICRDFPDATTARFFHRNKTITKYNFDSVCGNVHFPPNAVRGYDTNSGATVSSSCANFGFSFAKTNLNQNNWKMYGLAPYGYTDCGGEFLTWWFQRMPWQGSGHRYESGALMPAVGPYLFY